MAVPYKTDVLLPRDPPGALNAVTKQYADAGDALNAPLTRLITAGAGLTGGGDLTADRTLTVAYGTTSSTSAVGDDARLSDSRAPSGGATGALNGTYPSPGLIKAPWTPVTVTYAATVTTDASTGNHFRITLTGALTLANPTNPTDGQRVTWELIQDGTGSRLLTLGAAFGFGTDITAAVLTTTASKRDFLGCIYNSTAAKWFVLALSKGY